MRLFDGRLLPVCTPQQQQEQHLRPVDDEETTTAAAITTERRVMVVADHPNVSSSPHNDVDASFCATMNGSTDNTDAGDEDWESVNNHYTTEEGTTDAAVHGQAERTANEDEGGEGSSRSSAKSTESGTAAAAAIRNVDTLAVAPAAVGAAEPLLDQQKSELGDGDGDGELHPDHRSTNPPPTTAKVVVVVAAKSKVMMTTRIVRTTATTSSAIRPSQQTQATTTERESSRLTITAPLPVDKPTESEYEHATCPQLYECRRLAQRIHQENIVLRGNLERCDRLHRQELQLARQEVSNLQTEITQLRRERHDAIHEKQQLLHAVQGAVVERTAGTTAHGFPTGDDIVSKLEEFGEDTVFLAKDLARALVVYYPGSFDVFRAEKQIQTMLQHHFTLTKRVTEEKVVAGKMAQFVAFIGHYSNAVNTTLAELLWQSTMQNYVKTLIRDDLKGLIDVDEKHWTAAEGLGMFDDGQVRPSTLVGFCKSILYLDLVCRFSKPQCFLFPNIGATVPFDSKLHKQVYLISERKGKAKTGEPVTVLFPGLYFVDPENGSMERPKVCAFVVAQITDNVVTQHTKKASSIEY
jgi:hypothetical protein